MAFHFDLLIDVTFTIFPDLYSLGDLLSPYQNQEALCLEIVQFECALFLGEIALSLVAHSSFFHPQFAQTMRLKAAQFFILTLVEYLRQLGSDVASDGDAKESLFSDSLHSINSFLALLMYLL